MFILRPSNRLPWNFLFRSIHTGSQPTIPFLLAVSKAYEPCHSPSSPEAHRPLAWARQLFEYRDKRLFEKWRKEMEGKLNVPGVTPISSSSPSVTSDSDVKSKDSTGPLKSQYSGVSAQEAARSVPSSRNAPLLHCVRRIVSWKDLNHKEKEIMDHFNLGPGSSRYEWQIVKNTASVNRLLRHVLHAIQVLPLRFPDGLPSDYETRLPPGHALPFEPESAWSHEERDRAVVARGPRPTALGREVEQRFSKQTLQELMRYQLRPDGSFVRRAHIHPAQELAPIPDAVLSRHLDQNYMRTWHKKRRDRHELFSEYYATKYEYQLNQDGREYRYSGMWRLRDANRAALEGIARNADGTYRGREVHADAPADYSPHPFRRAIDFEWRHANKFVG